MQPSDKIYLSESKINGAGRGVFAYIDLKEGESIELCPAILLKGEGLKLRSSELYNYYFLWDKQPDCAVVLGFGSLYNHSYTPNATYLKHLNDMTVEFIALSDIKKDEGITVNYNYGDPNDKSPLWISTIDASKKG